MFAADVPNSPPAQIAADPLAGLAADVGAILGVGADPTLQVTEVTNGVAATRTLGIGDEYRDGWKIAAITTGSVTLNKGKDVRTVALTGRKQLAVAPPPPPAAPVKTATTNAAVGGQKGVALAAAIAAGDIKGALALGATASDIAKILQGRGQNIDPSTAAWVRDPNGNYALGFAPNAPAVGRLMLRLADFSGFTPPGGVDALPTLDDVLGPPPPPPPPTAAQLAVGQLAMSGGSAQDVAAAMLASRGSLLLPGPAGAISLDPSTARFVQGPDGSLGVGMTSADGRQIMVSRVSGADGYPGLSTLPTTAQAFPRPGPPQ